MNQRLSTYLAEKQIANDITSVLNAIDDQVPGCGLQAQFG